MSVRRRVGGSLAVWLLGFGVLRVTLWAPEICPPIDRSSARDAAVASGDWIVRWLDDDGRYRYEYDRVDDEVIPGYNLVRHAGSTMALWHLVGIGESAFTEPAERATRWMLDRLVDTADGVAFAEAGESPKLGAAALLAVSLVLRRDATGRTDLDATLAALGRFMAGQQTDGGVMLARYSLTDRAPVPEETSAFSTGEAVYALALLHERFPEAGWDEPAWATLDYLATDRDSAEGLYPEPWPDQWAAYALEVMADWGLSDVHVEYARRLAGRFAFIMRWDAQRGTWPASVAHGFAPRGGAHGTWAEGMSLLWRVAGVDERLAPERAEIAEAVACTVGVLAERQADGAPEVDGAWFYDDRTRVDDQQHALSGLLLAEALLADPAGTPTWTPGGSP